MVQINIPKTRVGLYIRALRLPFISASAIPFIFGSLIVRRPFNFLTFSFGLVSAIATHLGANLLNDYADSRSGVDWQDKEWYNFFGGSKLIQERILSEAFYLKAALFFFSLAFMCAIILTVALKNLSILGYFLVIFFFSWSYSHKPFQFSYHLLGEFIIFLLFGPAVVMGAYFLQTGIFPDLKSFLLSVPLGLLTTNILFANEIPDYPQDKSAGKLTWVSILGPQRSYILYFLLSLIAFVFIAVNIQLGSLGNVSYLAFIFFALVLKASLILKKCSLKTDLIASSKLTIAVHMLVGIMLIMDALL